jgi:hypothetical protein
VGIGIRIKSADVLYDEIKGQEHVILNDVPSQLREARDGISAQLYTSQRDDNYDIAPQCDCGALRSKWRLGNMCVKCSTQVKDVMSGKIVSRVWIRSPHGVDKILSPIALMQLTQVLVYKRQFSYMHWLMDPRYQGARAHQDLNLQWLIDQGVKRGYNNFINNMEMYLRLVQEHIFKHRDIRERKQKDANRPLESVAAAVKEAIDCVLMNKEGVLSNHLGLPNKAMTVVEHTPTGAYTDPVSEPLINAAKTMLGVDVKDDIIIGQMSPERRTAACLFYLADYYRPYFANVLGRKPGAFRKMMCGTRVHMSMRCVVTALTTPHMYDELHLPWVETIAMLRVHFANKLYRRGYNQQEVLTHLHMASYTVDPVMSEIMDELLKEAGGFFYCYWNRNPSLWRGSYQRMRATQVGRDVNDHSIKHPVTNIAGFNVDYDGDQMTLYFLLDEWMAKAMEPFAPSKNVASSQRAKVLGDQIKQPRPAIMSLASWMADPVPITTKEQRAFLESVQV